MPPWPRPMEIARVLTRPASLAFAKEILSRQPTTACVGGLTLRRRGDRGPRAFVYLGPLEQKAFERIRDLIDTDFVVRIFREPEELLKGPLATADDPAPY